MAGFMRIVIWDVEHGACAMIQHFQSTPAGIVPGRLAMIDCGRAHDWSPSRYILKTLGRRTVDYLFITNADQDHMSDLQTLEDAGIGVNVLTRNPTYTGEQYRAIKLAGGPLTRDAAWYAEACGTFNQPVREPFNQHMGGITCDLFFNGYPAFTNTNDLSLAIFINFGGFSILLPGDLEKAGWRALLQRPQFVQRLTELDILVASHHGRANGFCPEVFNYAFPRAVIISDKPITHETQEGTGADYRAMTTEAGVYVETTAKRRHVLTTRRDGTIVIDVHDTEFIVKTECFG